MKNRKSKNYTFLFMAALSLLSLLCPASPARADSWQKIEDGLFYRIIEIPFDSEKIQIHALKIDLKKLKITPVLSEKNTSVKNLATKFDALVVANANFFDEKGGVLGLVKKDKKVLHPKKDISWWSVFCIRNDSAFILHSSQVTSLSCHQAFQAGPRLVIDGTIPRLKDELSKKTAVGINVKGEVILAVSDAPLPIKTLAEIFKRSESKSGLACNNALNLDGGSSSQLYINTKNLKVNLSSYMKIPVGIGVLKK